MQRVYRDDYVVTQAELAKELGCARSSICRLIQKGMPVTSDGLLMRRKSLEWIRFYTSGFGGGWLGELSLAHRAARALGLRGDRP